MKNKFASLLAPVILLEWGGILLYFYASGRLNSFLHPSFRLQVLVAGALLVACALVLFFTRKLPAVCECGVVGNCPEQSRSPLVGTWFFPVMLLLPLAIATIFTRDAYGANFLATRGIVETAAALPGLADKFSKIAPGSIPPTPAAQPGSSDSANVSNRPPTEDASAADFFKPDANGNIQVNVADLLYAAEEPTLRKPFAGKSAEIIGQFMPAKTNNPLGNRFKLVRLFMTCCAADAQPVSLLVERDVSQALPSQVGEMTWTKVIGEITFPVENGRTVAVLKARAIEAVDPPEESMLY